MIAKESKKLQWALQLSPLRVGAIEERIDTKKVKFRASGGKAFHVLESDLTIITFDDARDFLIPIEDLGPDDLREILRRHSDIRKEHLLPSKKRAKKKAAIKGKVGRPRKTLTTAEAISGLSPEILALLKKAAVQK